ncbi:MAG: hypothetical protein EZS28_049484, partial [Streblomastix strix]
MVMIVELRKIGNEETDLKIEHNKEFQFRFFRSNLKRYWTPPILLPITIPDAVIECYNKLGYYQYRDCSLQGRDIYGCG